jgi:hypothetical protein
MKTKSILFLICASVIAAGFITGCSSTIVDPGPAKTRVLVGPNVIDFGSVGIGLPKDTLIRFSNTGNDSITILSVKITGTHFRLISQQIPVTILAGAYQDFKVEFTPTDTNLVAEPLVFRTNGNDTTTSLLLRGTGLHYQAKVGSSYTFAGYDKDSNGVKKSGTDRTTVAYITDNGLFYAGQSNVREVVEISDTTYFHYESNGDVSIFFKGLEIDTITHDRKGAGWMRLPFGSLLAGVTLYTLPDTVLTRSIAGVPVNVHFGMNVSVDYVGAENILVGTETLSTQKVKLTIQVTLKTASATQVTTATDYYSYAPTIGYLAKEEKAQTVTPKSGKDGGSTKVLTQYQLK